MIQDLYFVFPPIKLDLLSKIMIIKYLRNCLIVIIIMNLITMLKEICIKLLTKTVKSFLDLIVLIKKKYVNLEK